MPPLISRQLTPDTPLISFADAAAAAALRRSQLDASLRRRFLRHRYAITLFATHAAAAFAWLPGRRHCRYAMMLLMMLLCRCCCFAMLLMRDAVTLFADEYNTRWLRALPDLPAAITLLPPVFSPFSAQMPLPLARLRHCFSLPFRCFHD